MEDWEYSVTCGGWKRKSGVDRCSNMKYLITVVDYHSYCSICIVADIVMVLSRRKSSTTVWYTIKNKRQVLTWQSINCLTAPYLGLISQWHGVMRDLSVVAFVKCVSTLLVYCRNGESIKTRMCDKIWIAVLFLFFLLRFFLGGPLSVRGFSTKGIGPRSESKCRVRLH